MIWSYWLFKKNIWLLRGEQFERELKAVSNGTKEMRGSKIESLAWTTYQVAAIGNWELWGEIRNLGSDVNVEDPLEKEMVTCSSTLAWKMPQTEEPGGLQFMGS